MSNKLSKRQYQLAFIELTKCLADDSLTIDSYKLLLSDLCNSYRKDWHNEKKKTV